MVRSSTCRGPHSYRPASAFEIIDRQGQVTPLPLPAGQYDSPRVSPDGRLVAYTFSEGNAVNIAVHEIDGTAQPRKLTFERRNQFPVWTRDNRHLVFQSDRQGDAGLFIMDIDAPGDV